jgi:hypothetical protein
VPVPKLPGGDENAPAGVRISERPGMMLLSAAKSHDLGGMFCGRCLDISSGIPSASGLPHALSPRPNASRLAKVARLDRFIELFEVLIQRLCLGLDGPRQFVRHRTVRFRLLLHGHTHRFNVRLDLVQGFHSPSSDRLNREDRNFAYLGADPDEASQCNERGCADHAQRRWI